MRLHRLMCYLYGSKDFCLTGVIADPQETLVLACYTDADHYSSQEDTKSSSGMFMCLEDPIAVGRYHGRAESSQQRHGLRPKPR